MSARLRLVLVLILTVCGTAAVVVRPLAASPGAPPASAWPSLERGFLAPPDDARIMMRWWWFGPTVSKAGLARELAAIKRAGIGGVEIQPLYPVTLENPADGLVTHPFLSPAFLEHLRFAADTARSEGLRVDLTLGSGWPFGGPTVNITDAAGKLRVTKVAVQPGQSRVPVPEIRTGERLIAAFIAPAGSTPTHGSYREVTTIVDGQMHLTPAPTTPHDAWYFVNSYSGMMVKRAAVGAEGFVLNHYDRAALTRYLASVGDRLLSALAVPPYAIFCDSLEVYDSDWTTSFLETFRTKRGYDLRPLLPLLAGGAGPTAEALRHDWGQTLTDLLDEQFMAPMAAWAASKHTRLRIQGYGVPPATLSSNAPVELPEGEGAQWKVLRASRWASSIGHLHNRPIISSETWTWLHSPSFMASPLDMKAEADLHFLQGINQLVGHGWPYTADGAAYPGWRMYAAGAFDDKNPWWIVMPDLATYLQRISYLMRQGRPANDIAVYLPVADTWAHFVPGKIASLTETMSQRIGPDLLPAILESGYNLDFVDTKVLGGPLTVEDGRLVIGASRFKAIVLPGIERIEPDTMRRLEDLARQGITIIATRRKPALAPGYLATPADHAAIGAAAQRLFGDSATPGRFVAQDRDLGAALAVALPPDVAVTSGARAFGFVHRTSDAGEIYFVANTSNAPLQTDATFRVTGAVVESWDAVSGVIEAVSSTPAGQGRRIRLNLPPYGSTIIVFPRTPANRRPGRLAAPQARPPHVVDLSTNWRVTLGSATTESWPTLRSWTDNETTRAFSGIGVYERTVDLDARLLRGGQRIYVDLGEGHAIAEGGPDARVRAWFEPPVRDAAVITINGTRVGSLWCPPYRLDVTSAVRPGTNQIRIEVGNLAINHMAGRALPDYKLLNLRYGVRFEPQDMDQVRPLPSGLLGPVRLIVGGPALGSVGNPR